LISNSISKGKITSGEKKQGPVNQCTNICQCLSSSTSAIF
jgi:hypothetical protein